MERFELSTPATPWQCATKLRHIPTSTAIVRVFLKKSISICLFGCLLRKRLILSACARSFTRLYSLFNHWLIVLYISSRSIGCAVLLGCKLSFCISSLLPATLSTKNGIKYTKQYNYTNKEWIDTSNTKLKKYWQNIERVVYLNSL